MAARAIWKGRIQFGSVDVPVKLYSAIEDRTVHFRLLDAKKKEPVKQKMVDPETGKVVEHEDIRRAFQTDSGELIVLDEDELEAMELIEAKAEGKIINFPKAPEKKAEKSLEEDLAASLASIKKERKSA